MLETWAHTSLGEVPLQQNVLFYWNGNAYLLHLPTCSQSFAGKALLLHNHMQKASQNNTGVHAHLRGGKEGFKEGRSPSLMIMMAAMSSYTPGKRNNGMVCKESRQGEMPGLNIINDLSGFEDEEEADE
eukprot:1155005-Pelagomonas_calceolata.AAC.1